MAKMLDKRRIYTLILIVVILVIWFMQEEEEQKAQQEPVAFQGQTMGTYYNIKYHSGSAKNYQPEIDSLLKQFNQALNHYQPASEISNFNNQDTFYFQSPYFYPVLQASKQVFEATNGAFDPTVAPLVNAWGFGPEGGTFPDSLTVDSLKKLVGFEKIGFDQEKVWKKQPGVMLDFSAIAKGYGVDVVADFLEGKEISSYLVDIGGEVVCKGTTGNNRPWHIGIEDPENSGQSKRVVKLRDNALATSGNYRQFYEKDGKKYPHTINPETGRPVDHHLLSASVLSSNCMLSDAYATAFMVMGTEKAKQFLKTRDDISGFLIYNDEDGKMATYASPGFEKITVKSAK